MPSSLAARLSGLLKAVVALLLSAGVAQAAALIPRGDRIGLVSNDSGSTVTTIHLRFEIKKAIDIGDGRVFTFVSPYTSLVEAHERLRAGNP